MTTINTIEDLIKLLDENPAWLEAGRARILTRELLELPQMFAEFVEATNRRSEAMQQEMNQRFDATDSAIAGIRRDMGVLKAGHARTSVLRATTSITDRMGLERVRNLNYDDLRALTLAADISDIPTNVIQSFRQADLVMEATDQAGETCYVAVEISYTANGRDTERAFRNAEFLTRFTGRRAYPAVASVHRDQRIEESLDSSAIFWHRIESDELESE